MIFVLSRLNMGQILRLQRLAPFPLRMTKWRDWPHKIHGNKQILFSQSLTAWKQIASATDNHQCLTSPGLYPFDSLRSLRVTVFINVFFVEITRLPLRMTVFLKFFGNKFLIHCVHSGWVYCLSFLKKLASQLRSPWAEEPQALKSNGSNFRGSSIGKWNNNYSDAIRIAFKLKIT